MKKFLKTNREAVILFLIFLAMIFFLGGCSKSETVEEFYWRHNSKCFAEFGTSYFDVNSNTFVCHKNTRILFSEKM